MDTETTGGSKWKEVPKAEWDEWVKHRNAEPLVNHCSEPPTLQARLDGKVIAIAKLYDGSEYHGGKNVQYFLPADETPDTDPKQPPNVEGDTIAGDFGSSHGVLVNSLPNVRVEAPPSESEDGKQQGGSK